MQCGTNTLDQPASIVPQRRRLTDTFRKRAIPRSLEGVRHRSFLKALDGLALRRPIQPSTRLSVCLSPSTLVGRQLRGQGSRLDGAVNARVAGSPNVGERAYPSTPVPIQFPRFGPSLTGRLHLKRIIEGSLGHFKNVTFLRLFLIFDLLAILRVKTLKFQGNDGVLPQLWAVASR
jgi:hypothetical protein